MQCPDCKTFKRADNCAACYRWIQKRRNQFSRALKKLAHRYLRVRGAKQLLLRDLAEILESTGDYRVKDKIRERIQREKS